ncbi:hypothetical protein CJ030_MR5G025009 [Morella rubra]|uniref:Uncharacterized protein n=1 Tax=Morella rubra TaxID=262757 RepID=A0A6A1VHK8_9ROSI|nr:hypothetical protein CJ030_MR5G025009 [Morella rubra]
MEVNILSLNNLHVSLCSLSHVHITYLNFHLTGELKKLASVVVDVKEKGLEVVPTLVRLMLEKNMFLFGSVEINEGYVTETVTQLTELQNARIHVAYNTNSRGY